MMSQIEKHKQLSITQITPNNSVVVSVTCPVWLFFGSKRLIAKGQISNSTPLYNINNNAPASPSIVPATFAFPVATPQFNFSKLYRSRKYKLFE
jgi:hypothetical protein